MNISERITQRDKQYAFNVVTVCKIPFDTFGDTQFRGEYKTINIWPAFRRRDFCRFFLTRICVLGDRL